MENKLKVVFVSNFMNHHQLSVALEMTKIYDYTFIATEPIAQEQVKMKYADMNHSYDFILRAYESDNYEKAKELINNADVVVYGSCPFDMIEKRLVENKLTFRYSERLFKNKTLIRKFHPMIWRKIYNQCTKYKNNNYYLLCASAYSAQDYAWYGAFKNKTYKWGYFPEVEKLDVNNLIKEKQASKKLKIVWCNRLVPYKHPELAVYTGKYLKENGYDFEIKIIGVGPLKDKINKLIEKHSLTENIILTGSMPTEEVRENLKKADISLLTADKGEGWGAVVNESMNCACAVLCNKFTGSVPFLVKDMENGLIYKNNKEFFIKLKMLVEDADLRSKLGLNAYKAITEVWNAKNAVNNFNLLVKDKMGLVKSNIDNGPCSRCK